MDDEMIDESEVANNISLADAHDHMNLSNDQGKLALL